MKPKTLEKWTWALIYGGLLAMCLGLFMVREGAAPGWVLIVIGAGLAATGVVLVFVRSRM